MKRILNWQTTAIGCLFALSSVAWSAENEPAGHDHGEHRHGAPAESGGHGGHRGPKLIKFATSGFQDIQLWRPDLTSDSIPAPDYVTPIKLPKTGQNGYHTLIATRRESHKQTAEIHYRYANGKPTGHSPSELLAINKTDFEIVPDPVPREHFRYRTDTAWDFLLRFQGKPVSGVPVFMWTANGSRAKSVSDENGRVRFLFQNDFSEIRPGRRANRPANFYLSAEHTQNGMQYQTILGGEYHVNPKYWQSSELALVVFGIGLVAGGFIGRVRKNGKSDGEAV